MTTKEQYQMEERIKRAIGPRPRRWTTALAQWCIKQKCNATIEYLGRLDVWRVTIYNTNSWDNPAQSEYLDDAIREALYRDIVAEDGE